MKTKNKIFTGGLFFAIAYGIVFYIPLYVESLGKTQAQSGIILGFLGAGAIFSSFMSQYISRLSSTYSTLLGGCIFYIIGVLCFSITGFTADWIYYLAGLLMGIGWGTYYNLSSILISKIAEPQERSTLFGYLSAFNVLGAGLLPIFFKFFYQDSIDYIFLFRSSNISVVIALFFFLTLPKYKLSPVTTGESMARFSIKDTVTHPVILPILIAFLSGCIFAFLINFQTIIAQKTGQNYAYFFLIYSIAVIASRFIISSRLAKYNQSSVCFNLILMTISALLLFLYSEKNHHLYLFATAFFGVSYGLLVPTLQGMTVTLTREKHHATSITFFTLAILCGSFLFPIIAGILINTMGVITTIKIIIAFAIIELIASICLLKIVKPCGQQKSIEA